MPEFVQTIGIDASPDAVWPVLAAVEGWPRQPAFLTRIRREGIEMPQNRAALRGRRRRHTRTYVEETFASTARCCEQIGDRSRIRVRNAG